MTAAFRGTVFDLVEPTARVAGQDVKQDGTVRDTVTGAIINAAVPELLHSNLVASFCFRLSSITSTAKAISDANFVAAGHVLTLAADATVSGTNTGDQTNISGNAATVTTNANLTGEVTSVGNAATVTRSTVFNWTAAHTFSDAGATSTPAVALTGTPFAGTGTTSFPQFYLNQSTATASTTLSTAGTFFGINSHGTQDLINLMVDGVNKVKVDSSGTASFLGGAFGDNLRLGDLGSSSTYFKVGRVSSGNLEFAAQQANNAAGFRFLFGPSSSGSSATYGFIVASNGGTSYLQVAYVTGYVGINQNTPGAQLEVDSSGAAVVAEITKAAASRSVALKNFQTSAAGTLGNVSGGCIGDVFADTSTTHTDGTEDQLGTITTVANALIVNGDSIRAKYVLKMVGSATATRRVQIYFAGIVIFDSTALTIGATAGVVIYDVLITRATSTTCRAIVEQRAYGSATLLGVDAATYTPEGTLTGLTLTGTNILKITGIAAGTGAASGDITLVLGKNHVDGFGS